MWPFRAYAEVSITCNVARYLKAPPDINNSLGVPCSMISPLWRTIMTSAICATDTWLVETTVVRPWRAWNVRWKNELWNGFIPENNTTWHFQPHVKSLNQSIIKIVVEKSDSCWMYDHTLWCPLWSPFIYKLSSLTQLRCRKRERTSRGLKSFCVTRSSLSSQCKTRRSLSKRTALFVALWIFSVFDIR